VSAHAFEVKQEWRRQRNAVGTGDVDATIRACSQLTIDMYTCYIDICNKKDVSATKSFCLASGVDIRKYYIVYSSSANSLYITIVIANPDIPVVHDGTPHDIYPVTASCSTTTQTTRRRLFRFHFFLWRRPRHSNAD
jgi:hypothetical protein